MKGLIRMPFTNHPHISNEILFFSVDSSIDCCNMFSMFFHLRHFPPLLPGKRTDSARADEPPAKRIKLEPTDMFKEEDVTSLPKPSLVCQLFLTLFDWFRVGDQLLIDVIIQEKKTPSCPGCFAHLFFIDQVCTLKAQVCDQQCCGAGHQWSRGLPIFGVTCEKPVPSTPWIVPCHSNLIKFNTI